MKTGFYKKLSFSIKYHQNIKLPSLIIRLTSSAKNTHGKLGQFCAQGDRISGYYLQQEKTRKRKLLASYCVQKGQNSAFLCDTQNLIRNGVLVGK